MRKEKEVMVCQVCGADVVLHNGNIGVNHADELIIKCPFCKWEVVDYDRFY